MCIRDSEGLEYVAVIAADAELAGDILVGEPMAVGGNEGLMGDAPKNNIDKAGKGRAQVERVMAEVEEVAVDCVATF